MDMTATNLKRKAVIDNLKKNNWIDTQTRGVLFSLALDNPHVEFIIVLRFAVQIPGVGVMLVDPELYVFYYGVFGPIKEKLVGSFLLILCLIYLTFKMYLLVHRKDAELEEEEVDANEKDKVVQCNCPRMLKIFNVFRVPKYSEVIGTLLSIKLCNRVAERGAGIDKPLAQSDFFCRNEGFAQWQEWICQFCTICRPIQQHMRV
eukprot:TRINITY_DN120494_c0_g1_i1.p6 TRINITY_DN120494_c0_g1~~TRINITY_DN120494_c0_g1_i1.p6  ORF type:complete len:204 (+),score=14.71 TRINITY_DN120494_c0_g1_i1:3441-4052(+)